MDDSEWKWEAIPINPEQNVIEQYPNNGTDETLFNVIQEEEKKDNLRFFLITPRSQTEEREYVAVDLTNGMFVINDMYINVAPQYANKNYKYRIVYHRRCSVEMTFGGEFKSKSVIYLIGWQITLNGENIQRILFFDPETKIARLEEKR
jgi:hypothetical protein